MGKLNILGMLVYLLVLLLLCCAWRACYSLWLLVLVLVVDIHKLCCGGCGVGKLHMAGESAAELARRAAVGV